MRSVSLVRWAWLAVAVAVAVVLLLALAGDQDGPAPPRFDVSSAFVREVVVPARGRPVSLTGGPRAIARRVDRSAQRAWRRAFSAFGLDYRSVEIGFARTPRCGSGREPIIGVYCREDGRIYLLLGEYDAMREEAGARAAARAWAYVVAHEIAHHVQYIRGTLSEIDGLVAIDPRDDLPLSVRAELQADCYAGVWSHAVGQPRPPEVFFAGAPTHGTGAQQRAWLEIGRASGRPADCHTFSDGAVVDAR